MSKDAGKQPGNPFRMMTVALVIVVVVMALITSTRQMDRDLDDRNRMAAAESEVAAVGLFLDEGDVPNAVIALHDIGLRLGRVTGAEDAARAVIGAIDERRRAHEATTEELRRARVEIAALKDDLTAARQRTDFGTEQNRALAATRDRNALVLKNIAEGRTELARRLLATGEKDVVGTAARSLLSRIDALAAAADASGAERVHLLRSLARTWPVDGLEDIATFAGEEENRRQTARSAVAAAADALDRKDQAGAHEALVKALSAAGVPEIRELTGRLVDLGLREGAVRAEKEGRMAEAAGAWRMLGETAKAAKLEESIARKATGEFLTMEAREFQFRKDWFGAAALCEAAFHYTQDETIGKEMEKNRARGWLHLADEYRKRGLLRAAAYAAVAGTNHDPSASEPIADGILAEIEMEKVQMSFREASQAAADGNPDRAASIVKDLDAPAELTSAIEEAKRARDLERARIALHAGDGKAALALLEGVEKDGPLTAEARLLAGDVAKGAAGLTGTAEEKSLVLLGSAWKVLAADPARAARLGLAAIGLTELRPAAIRLLEAALKKAGDPAKGDELWDTVRSTIFAAEVQGMGAR